MGNFLEAISDLFGPRDEEGLKKIAAQFGGQYQKRELRMEYGGVAALYDLAAVGMRDAVDTRVRAEFPTGASFHLVVSGPAGSAFSYSRHGWQANAESKKYDELPVDGQLFRGLELHGTDGETAAGLFDEETARLLRRSGLHTLQIHCGHGHGTFLFMIGGSVSDPDRFGEIHRLLGSLFGRMTEKGLAGAGSAGRSSDGGENE